MNEEIIQTSEFRDFVQNEFDNLNINEQIEKFWPDIGEAIEAFKQSPYYEYYSEIYGE